MKVRDLIEKLGKLDPDLPVAIADDEQVSVVPNVCEVIEKADLGATQGRAVMLSYVWWNDAKAVLRLAQDRLLKLPGVIQVQVEEGEGLPRVKLIVKKGVFEGISHWPAALKPILVEFP